MEPDLSKNTRELIVTKTLKGECAQITRPKCTTHYVEVIHTVHISDLHTTSHFDGFQKIPECPHPDIMISQIKVLLFNE